MKKYGILIITLTLLFLTGIDSTAQSDPIITVTYADLVTNTLHIEGINLPSASPRST